MLLNFKFNYIVKNYLLLKENLKIKIPDIFMLNKNNINILFISSNYFQ